MTSSLVDYAQAAPLVALTAHGLGPVMVAGGDAARVLASLRGNAQGVVAAVETIGATGRRLLSVLAALGGSITLGELDFQTQGAKREVVDEAVGRLVAARLVERRKDGSLVFTPGAAGVIAGATISLADGNVVTSDVLALMCRALHVQAPTRKQDRIDAIAAAFADPSACRRIRRELSREALDLLERIVDVAGPRPLSPEEVGIARYALVHGAPARFAYQRGPRPPEVEMLLELTSRGIVGVSEWDHTLWIWREAWPLVDRPFYNDWPVVPRPTVARVAVGPPAVPRIVATLDLVMRRWHASPPTVLKNGDHRVGKAEVRSTAKAIGVDEVTADVAARLAISIGLVLDNVVSATGRGRQRTVERAWMQDPTLGEAWHALAPLARWSRLFAEWCKPTVSCGEQLLVNRHLVLWELANLEPDVGVCDDEAFTAWCADRYATLVRAGAVLECLADLRALGAATATGPLALTAVCALALADPARLLDLDVGDSSSAVVQADLTIIAPPDLRPDLAVRVAALAHVESEGGATIYRLDVVRVARAVQGGETEGSIVEFLTTLSSVPLPDTVLRCVRDGAARAGGVRVIAAPTVVVFGDPADLVTACAVKAAQLTAIGETIAVSELPYAKVSAALDRKGLMTDVVVGAGRPVRSSAFEAAQLAARAASYESASRGRSSSPMAFESKRLAASSRALADTAARLRVTGPLALTPALVAGLGR